MITLAVPTSNKYTVINVTLKRWLYCHDTLAWRVGWYATLQIAIIPYIIWVFDVISVAGVAVIYRISLCAPFALRETTYITFFSKTKFPVQPALMTVLILKRFFTWLVILYTSLQSTVRCWTAAKRMFTKQKMIFKKFTEDIVAAKHCTSSIPL